MTPRRSQMACPWRTYLALTFLKLFLTCRDSRILPDGVLQRVVPRVEWSHPDDVSGVREDAARTLYPRRLQPRMFQRRRSAVRRAVLGSQDVRRQRSHTGRHTTVSAWLRVLPRGQLHLRHRYSAVECRNSLTLWRPLLPYGYSYKASFARPG